jgi:hypothetical protein
VAVRREPVSRVVADEDGRVAAVELAGGERLAADAVAVGPRFRARAEPFLPLDLRPAPHPSGLGDHLATDPTGATAIPGVYAAGNVADPTQQVLQAAADGARVGAMISFSLAGDDIRAAARPSANEADWDRRYSGAQMWSGNPNGALVNEIEGMPPARAPDVGAGEGGDALWLAERGWDVTASDISRRALDRIERRDRAARPPCPAAPRRRERACGVRGRGPSIWCWRCTRRSRGLPMPAVFATCSTRSRRAASCSP